VRGKVTRKTCGWAVVLFFAWVARDFQAISRAEGQTQLQLQELHVVVEKLTTVNVGLKQELEQREAVIRTLMENLAIARTESELFQKRWQEAQLRAQTLGVNFADDAASQAQRQLVESVRALYLAEAERQRLVEQLRRLLAAVETDGDVRAEAQRAEALLAATGRVFETNATAAVQPRGALDAARVLEFNAKLRLVVLDVGAQQGARVGMPFLVLRGDRVIAQVRVVEVRQRICGALIEQVDKGVTVQAGDGARVTKS